MSRMRHLMHSDAVTKEIVAALRAAGVVVEYFIAPMGKKGAPDLVCGWRGDTWLVEVKKPGADLDDEQRTWWKNWRGGRLALVHSPAEALAALGIGEP